MKQEIGVITLTYGKRKVDNIAGWMHLKKMYRTRYEADFRRQGP